MKISFLYLHGIACAGLLVLAAGCGTPQTRFTVTPSSLNYMHVTFATTNQITMMEFQGTGYCTLRRGENPGLTNPFSLTAHNTTELRREFSGEEMVNFFQAFVNLGVFDKEPKENRALSLPYVSLSGRIENKGFSRISKTPELLEWSERMMAVFDIPEEHRRKLQ